MNKPIQFNTEMVQAILGGRKTQTRRIAFKNDDLREFNHPPYTHWLGKVLDYIGVDYE